jgi:glycosyltransferase involved in cell wall biosynthesis
MKIGFYTPNYPGITHEGGIGSYTRSMALGLSDLGHDVHVLTPGDRATTFDGRVAVHFTRTDHCRGIDRLMPGTGACVRVARSMRRLVKQHRLDVIEFANWEGYGLLFQWTRRPPTVVRLATSSKEAQEIDGTRIARRHRWDVYRERWQARSADLLVTHSDAHRRLMAAELGIDVNRIRLVPLGVSVAPEWTRPWKDTGSPSIVYLGRLEHRKGTVELLQAVPRILQCVPDARFVLIGADRPHCPGGRTHAEYLKQDFSLEVQRKITLAGRLPQADVDRWLQSADLFVAPSRYESFGLIFIEAMRWGTPVVGTTAGAIPEVVEHGVSGILVRPEAPNELAEAIVKLLKNPGQRAKLGAEGRRRVEAEFSVQRMCSRVTALYEEMIIHRRSRCRDAVRPVMTSNGSASAGSRDGCFVENSDAI